MLLTVYFLLFAGTVIPTVLGLYPQYVMFYPDLASCRGTEYEYSFDSINITAKPWTRVAHKFRGIWVITSPAGGTFGALDGEFCITSDYINHLHAMKLVDTELEDSGIALIRDVFQSDMVVISSAENEWSLPEPEPFDDIAFTGINSYTIFEGINFTGHSTCVIPFKDSLEEGYGSQIVYPPWDGRLVGSFRVGCDGEEDTIVELGDNGKGMARSYGTTIMTTEYIEHRAGIVGNHGVLNKFVGKHS